MRLKKSELAQMSTEDLAKLYKQVNREARDLSEGAAVVRMMLVSRNAIAAKERELEAVRAKYSSAAQGAS